MVTNKCPMCESPCIIKLIATSDARWCKVDVCKMCGTMYPRDRDVVIAAPAEPVRKKRAPAKKAGAAKSGAGKPKKRK